MASEGAHLEVEMSTESMLDDQYTPEDEIIGYVEPWIASPGQTVEVKECLSDPFINTTANMVPVGFKHRAKIYMGACSNSPRV